MLDENEALAYSIKDVCRVVNAGQTKIYSEINAGRLKAVKLGKRTLITSEALKEWLNALPQIGGAE